MTPLLRIKPHYDNNSVSSAVTMYKVIDQNGCIYTYDTYDNCQEYINLYYNSNWIIS